MEAFVALTCLAFLLALSGGTHLIVQAIDRLGDKLVAEMRRQEGERKP